MVTKEIFLLYDSFITTSSVHFTVKHFFVTFQRLNASQLVTLVVGSTPISIFCHMGDFGCGGGGWTPVIKMDGNKVCWARFPFDSESGILSDWTRYAIVDKRLGTKIIENHTFSAPCTPPSSPLQCWFESWKSF